MFPDVCTTALICYSSWVKFKLHSEYEPAGDPAPRNGVVGIASFMQMIVAITLCVLSILARARQRNTVFGAWAGSDESRALNLI